jgi:hypothetical protein
MNFRTTIYCGALASLLIAASACSTPGPEKPDPVEQALSQSKDAVVIGIDEGFEESESVEPFVVEARLNPCRCEAPRFEIYAHGRWTRVFLEGDEALLAEIDEQLSQRIDELEFGGLALRGAIDGQETTSEGIQYAVFEVEEIEENAENAESDSGAGNKE